MIGRIFQRFVFRPVAKLGTLLKRKPGLVLLLLLIVWFLPSPMELLGWFSRALANIAVGVITPLLRVLPERWLKPFAVLATWAMNRPACALAFLVMPFSPVLGFALAAWCFTSRIKAAMDAPALNLNPAPITIDPPKG